MRSILFLPASVLFVAGLPAQLTISDANVSVTTAAPASTSNLPRALDLVSDALALDQAFEHWWYYRVDGDAGESALRDTGDLSGGVTTNGTHVDRDFADLDGRGLLKASVDMDVYSAGPASGVFISRMTLMNISSGPLDIEAFGYMDVDIAGSFGNDTCSATLARHQVTDPTGILFDIRGVNADASDVAAFPALRNALSNNAVTTLSTPPVGFAGDYTGAFQWGVTLEPFEQRTFTVVIAIDTTANVPPRVENYGAGNGSVFEIHANELPLQDLATPRSFSVRLKGALPAAEFRLVTALSAWTPMPFIPGLDLWIDPVSIIAVVGGVTDANGDAAETYVIPTSAYLTGLSIFHQGFYVDAAAPNGFGYFTGGLQTRIGKL